MTLARAAKQLTLAAWLRPLPGLKNAARTRRELRRFVARARRRGWTIARLATWLGISERQFYRYLAGRCRVPPYVARTVRHVHRITNREIRLAA